MEDKTIEELKKIGDAEALCEMGLRYYYGKEVEKNYEKAYKYFKKAMEMGSARGKYDVAISCYEGKGVEKNYEMAYKLLQELKEIKFDGLTEEMVITIKLLESQMYYYGNYVEKNYKKAFEKFNEVANLYNNKQAIDYLAYMYYFGQEVEVNYKIARKYYENILDEEYDEIYYRLGKIYKEGLECEKDEEKAEKYFNKVEKDIFRVTIYAMLALNEEKDCSFDVILKYTEMDFKFFIDWIEAFPDKHPCRLYLKKLKSLKDTEYRDIADMFMERIKKYSKENKIRGDFEDEDDVEKYISEIID